MAPPAVTFSVLLNVSIPDKYRWFFPRRVGKRNSFQQERDIVRLAPCLPSSKSGIVCVWGELLSS